ncbi:YlbG family protein [Numidum massiliense]|uniref:YlbG family protein n=1 Tax=Numidum massiliense TaxID=1522315 RepID=UPI0006D5A2EC|nr:YlbG family protein [Numidum massiliense]
MQIAERTGLAVWVKDLRKARSLGRYGNIHYMSKKLNYVCMYIDARKESQLMNRIQKMPFVIRVEKSKRKEIPTEYDGLLDQPWLTLIGQQ